jgi:L-rhamnose mutarotase
MIRKAFMIRARKGMTQEYIRRHQPIWPELQQALTAHGVHNYSIFLHEESGMLFGYMEVLDEALLNELPHDRVMKRWWKYMTEVLESEDDTSEKAIEHSLIEVFHLK